MNNYYNLILADPPWQQLKGGLRKARPKQERKLDYNTAPVEEIELHISSVPKAENSVLFIWTIDKFFWQAERMAERLNYKLHARLIWDKTNGVAPAFTVRFAHEYLLWFYKGKFTPIAEEQRGKYTTVLREKSTKHSKKPLIAYEMIENFFPNADKLEMYARQKRDGWDVFGNEVTSDIKLKEDV